MRPMQLTITLDGFESDALRKSALSDLRRPKEQARYLLRQALGLASEDVRPQQMESHTSVGQDITGVAAS